MRKTILVAFVLATQPLLLQLVEAQGTTYISNLGQPAIASGHVASDSWLAQLFTTGTNSSGYALNSVQLLMNAPSGSPAGFSISIYSSPGNAAPGTSLATLTGPDPASGGLFSYSASGLLLSPSTFYFIVATSTTPVAQGAYEWSAADSFGQIIIGPGDPWKIQDAYYTSATGSSWVFTGRQNIFQFAINGTAVPEPQTCSLIMIGFGLFWCARYLHTRKKRPNEDLSEKGTYVHLHRVS